MSDLLATILEHKRREVAALDLASLRRAAEVAPAARDFVAALCLPPARMNENGSTFALIAELKRASPSRGLLAPGKDLLEVATMYEQNGATAVSVITDEKFFLGDLATLQALRFEREYRLPLLRKDFIIDEVQVFESRAAGADAVLLIAAALPDDGRLAALHALAIQLGLAPLVEVHSRAELERALRLDGLRLVGINNRDLSTFQVDIGTCLDLRPFLPQDVTVIAESGINSREHMAALARAGLHAALVGEALMTAPDVAAKVRELAGLRLPAPDKESAQS
jgi:indole-3-glycerol phosphate synthase